MTGGQQAIFLEAWHGGARSRDGSLRYPRRLVTLRGALDLEQELVVQPVAISYSIVPEDLSLAARRGGLTWLRGMGLWSTLGRVPLHPRSWVWRSVQDLYGRARVSLPRPLLLSELRERHAADPGGMVLDEYVALTAIREIARSKKVMASQLTARGLVRARRQMVERGDQAAPPDLAEATELERERLAEYHRGAFGQEPDLEDFIREHPTKEVVADGLRALKRRGVVAGWRSLGAGKAVVKSEAGLAFYANHGDRRIYSPTADQNLVVVGAGSWGFALTSLVGNRILEEKRYLNASLTLYDPREEVAREMGVTRRPPGRFEEHRLPKNAFVTADPPSAFKKASEVILASPPDKLAERAAALMRESEQPLKVVVATCGFEPQGHRLPCQVVLDAAEAAGRRDVAVYALVGPVTADDLVLAKPVSGILAGPAGGRSELADLFRWPPAAVEAADDALGTQAAAILARVYALWGNVLARLGETVLSSQLGHYMARATAEAARLAQALGGRPETFAAGAPAWTTVFVDSGLHGPVREFGRKVGQTAKRGDGAAAAARKLAQQMDQEGEAPLAYLDLLSAHEASLRLGVAAPILERARRTLWGG
jgi:glycerol-3-phosphate dehydrogenase